MDDVRLCAATDRKARFFNCCLVASRTITNAVAAAAVAAVAAACRRMPRRACVTMMSGGQPALQRVLQYRNGTKKGFEFFFISRPQCNAFQEI